ncbi:uncharacterized protein A1O9_02931 [Exophiala aquamarina CBS 119918]|uniref:Methyltransferase domain-containing protein n=1 Tax=Exophiala aquamarina CBS 119918 TaxID=1182545 RepID=A0A072Q0G1_9EURO|nr:uncharacterized protein A1O9_02931 [Exophiala aquamarina CBS 119918]KEF61365.1 hypothetical protein A1O9_02931 [Exophiala aquamarina CBS 119918]
MAAEPSLKADTISARLYQATLKVVPSAVAALLAEYSKIPVEDQKAHITKIRDQAYEKHPYPCLGRWRFLELDLSTHPLYHSDILPALTGEDRKQDNSTSDGSACLFLDLGCCLGQDLRKLIFDGADPSRLWGADLRPEFIEIGYSLFGDRESFPPSHFIAPADVFDLSPSTPLAQMDGEVGILHVCAVFHLFDLDGQKKMAQRALKLLDPNKKRVLVVGAQTANVNSGEFERRVGDGRTRYRHNAESWRSFWEEAVQAEQWKDIIRGVEVDTILEEVTSTRANWLSDSNTTQRQIGLFEEGFRWMKFSVWVDFV